MSNPLFEIGKRGEIKLTDFSAWGGFEGFLRDTSNGAGGYAQANLLKRISPFLSHAIDMTATAIAYTLPFSILNDKGDVIDTSEDYQNIMGCLPNPRRWLYLLTSSLCGGKAYCIPERTSRMITSIRYVAPHTVLPLITTNGLQWFSRASDYGNAGVYSPIIPFPAIKSLDGDAEIPKGDKADIVDEIIDLTIKNYYGDIEDKKLKAILQEQNKQAGFTGEMLYFWLPDSDIEIGPSKKHPIGTAMAAAQLAADMDNSVGLLARRNFVPATLVSAKGMPAPKDREVTENWLNRFMRGAFETYTKIINADAVSIVKLGSGMEDFKGAYSEIKRQAIEEMGAAFGIPAAVFMSDKAFASEMYPEIRMWYTTGIFTAIYQTIQETVNHQLLNEYGYEWKFDLTRHKAFQEDENKRATAFREYASARVRPSLIAGILGIDMPEGHDVSELDEQYDKPETSLPVNPISNPELPVTESKDPAANMNDTQNADIKLPEPKSFTLNANEISDLALWKQAAKRWWPKGKSAVDWEPKYLSPELTNMIRERLVKAENELDIVKAFEITASESRHQQSSNEIKMLADAINKSIPAATSPATQQYQPQPIIIDTSGQQVKMINQGNADILSVIKALIENQIAPTVTVNVPEQPTPNVYVKNDQPAQLAPIVNVTIPDQPAPVVNVNVPTQPAPVVNVNEAKRTKSKQTIVRDNQGTMTGSETEHEYEE